MDIAFKRGVTNIGSILSPDAPGRLSSIPSIFGISGPCMSASIRPTSRPFIPRANARFAATVVFPTPPFPLITITLCFTFSIIACTALSCSATLLLPSSLSSAISYITSYQQHSWDHFYNPASESSPPSRNAHPLSL